jgi:hypothetical protein
MSKFVPIDVKSLATGFEGYYARIGADGADPKVTYYCHNGDPRKGLGLYIVDWVPAKPARRKPNPPYIQEFEDQFAKNL